VDDDGEGAKGALTADGTVMVINRSIWLRGQKLSIFHLLVLDRRNFEQNHPIFRRGRGEETGDIRLLVVEKNCFLVLLAAEVVSA
jgi:hypothetical protein